MKEFLLWAAHTGGVSSKHVCCQGSTFLTLKGAVEVIVTVTLSSSAQGVCSVVMDIVDIDINNEPLGREWNRFRDRLKSSQVITRLQSTHSALPRISGVNFSSSPWFAPEPWFAPGPGAVSLPPSVYVYVWPRATRLHIRFKTSHRKTQYIFIYKVPIKKRLRQLNAASCCCLCVLMIQWGHICLPTAHVPPCVAVCVVAVQGPAAGVLRQTPSGPPAAPRCAQKGDDPGCTTFHTDIV